jgi:hypothetical protein
VGGHGELGSPETYAVQVEGSSTPFYFQSIISNGGLSFWRRINPVWVQKIFEMTPLLLTHEGLSSRIRERRLDSASVGFGLPLRPPALPPTEAALCLTPVAAPSAAT